MGKAVLHHILFFVSLLVLQVSLTVPAESSDLDFHILASNNPPFNYQDENGAIQGIAVDILSVIMERAFKPVDVSTISVINWARAVHETTSRPGHILLSPARTPQREDLFAWVGPIHSFKLGLISLKHRKLVVRDESDLKKLTIGVVRDSAPAQIMVNKFGMDKDDLVELANDDQLFLMLERGRVDLIPRGAMSATYWLERLELDPDQHEMVNVLKEMDLYIGFSPTTDPELIHRLNRELLKLKKRRPDGTSEYQAIVNRHIHGNPIRIRTETP